MAQFNNGGERSLEVSVAEPTIGYGNTYGSVEMGGQDILIQGNNPTINYTSLAPQLQVSRFEQLFSSLSFDRMDERLRNVSAAMPSTCRWIFAHPQFLTWLDHNSVPHHNGFLWIKGKPGSGKSTLMKEVHSWTEANFDGEAILHYFYNARSQDVLEKSSIGLYRSMLYQLLVLTESVKDLFAKRFRSKVSSGKIQEWTEVEICNFLRDTIERGLINQPLKILVDALDEGKDEDVRDMVAFFEDLADRAILNGVSLRILFSSRHYPHIGIKKGLFITLEDQDAHKADIARYIEQQAPLLYGLQMLDLRQRILEKSAGVFLWVLLVIPILRRINDRGGQFSEMLEKLDSIPPQLSDLFNEILHHDAEGLEITFRLLRWVLCSMEPLIPMEALHICHLHDYGVSGKYINQIPDNLALARNILHCSRGLVEITRTSRPVVQFIHETVRDFLINYNPYARQLPQLHSPQNVVHRDFKLLTCHKTIALDCLQYLLIMAGGIYWQSDLDHIWMPPPPLMWYAMNYWCIHTKLSHGHGRSNTYYLAVRLLIQSHICPPKWLNIFRLGYRHQESLLWALHGDNVLCRAVNTGLLDFFRWVLALLRNNTSLPSCLSSALAAAAARGFKEMSHDLLTAGADASSHSSWDASTSPLAEACFNGHSEIVQMLLKSIPTSFFSHDNTLGSAALNAASISGHIDIVNALLDAGARLQVSDPRYENTIAEVASQGDSDVVQELVKSLNIIRVDNVWFVRAVNSAIDSAEEETLKILLVAGRKSNPAIHHSEIYLQVLYAAFTWLSQQLIQFLLSWTSDSERWEHLIKVLCNALENEDWDVVTNLTFYCGIELLSACPMLEAEGGREWYMIGKPREKFFRLERGVAVIVELEYVPYEPSSDESDEESSTASAVNELHP